MSTIDRVRDAFVDQAGWCTKLGSPFTALVCSTLAERLDDSTPVGRQVLGWEGNPGASADALPLRVCGGLHALARAAKVPELAKVYPPAPLPAREVLWEAIHAAFEDHVAHFDAYLKTAPQTNEVGRSAALVCGLLTVAYRTDLPLQLFEIGASAGLNLILDRYRYRFGAMTWGPRDAAVLLEPEWQGGPPPTDANLRIVARLGGDFSPIDATSSEARARLVSYVWADQADRLTRLEGALATALRDPPRVERMEAAEWVESRINSGAPGVARVLYHSLVWNYLPQETQRRMTEHMERRGAEATPRAPLAWLRFELEEQARGAALRLRLWPTGEEVLLATSQPHGKSIHWLM